MLRPPLLSSTLHSHCFSMYNTLNNPSAHPSYSHYYLLSPSTLFFFFCTSYCFLHILLFFAHLVVFCTSCCLLHILLSFAHLVVFCTSCCLLHILLSFAHLVVFCTSCCLLHILLSFAHLIVLHFFLFHCTFYSYFSFSYHMYAFVLCHFI